MNNIFHKIFILIFFFVICAHRGVQAQTIDQNHGFDGNHHKICDNSNCDFSQQNLDICERVEDAQLKNTDIYFILLCVRGVGSILNKVYISGLPVQQIISKNIELSYKELARSHI